MEMTSRFHGVPAELVAVLTRAELALSTPAVAAIDDGLDDALRAAADRVPEYRDAVLAVVEAVIGNWPKARLLVQSTLAGSLRPPTPWGVVALTLTADAGRPDVLIDWTRRLTAARPDDRAVASWAAVTLASRGDRAFAVATAQQHPDVASDSWVGVMAGVAADQSRLDLASDWLLGWAESSTDALGSRGRTDVRLVELATALLPRPDAAAVGRALLRRLPPADGAFREDVLAWIFDLVEVAEDAELAVKTLMRCAGHDADQPVLLEAARRAIRTHATNVRPIFAALVNEGIWSSTGALAEGFRAVQNWSGPGAYDPWRALDVLYLVLDGATSTAVEAMPEEIRAAAVAAIHVALQGETDTDRIREALFRCERLGLALAEAQDEDWYVAQMSLAAVRDADVRRDITSNLRAGRADRAHLLAREATFVEMLGPAPAGLLVDALVEGGSHGEAHQLAAELQRRFPNDAVAGLKLAMTYVWYGRQTAARLLIERSLRMRWRAVAGAAFLFRWASNVHPDAAAAACRTALASAQFATEHAAISSLLAELQGLDA